MRRVKRMIAVLLVIAMMFTMAPAAFAAGTSFSDVPRSAWYYESVQWAVEQGITGGTGANTFSPDAACTRGQVVMFLWAAAGKPEPNGRENAFTDVSKNDYFYKAVLWAVEEGITGGIGDRKFGPDNPCTRAQVVTFLYAVAGKPDVLVFDSTFSDVRANDWFREEVQWAVSNGITGGIGGGKFGPDQTCTRGQIVTFLYKADQIGPEPEPATKVLKVAFNRSISDPEAQTLQWVSDKLYERTDGRYKLEIYPDAQLGNQAQTLEQVTMGTLDMTLVANSVVETYSSDFAILGAPYVFDSIDHQNKVLQSDALDELYSTTEQHGFTVLSAYSLGARNLYTRDRAVTVPEDLSGMKIRVMASETCINMMNAMGGVGIAMAQGDVYSAIQVGTLDGAENNIVTYVDLVQYEVAPYYNLTGHMMIPDELVIANDILAAMSAKDAAILQQICKESVQVCYDKAGALRTEYQKTAEEKGVTFTEADVPAFRALCAGLIYDVANRNDVTKNTYDAIRSHSSIVIPEPDPEPGPELKRLTQVNEYDSDDDKLIVHKLEYDENNRLIYYSGEDYDGPFEYEFTYNANGQVIRYQNAANDYPEKE